jgi:hypothetical protein
VKVVKLGEASVVSDRYIAVDPAVIGEFGNKTATGGSYTIAANTDTARGIQLFFVNTATASAKCQVLEIDDDTIFEGQMKDINYQNAIGARCNIAMSSNVVYLEQNTGGRLEVVDVPADVYPFEANGTQANGLVWFKVIPAAIEAIPAAR